MYIVIVDTVKCTWEKVRRKANRMALLRVECQSGSAFSSSYNMWKHLGAIINPNKKKRTCDINKFLCDGKFITDNKHIADSINIYLCKIGSHLQQLMQNCGTEYNRYPPNRKQMYSRPVLSSAYVCGYSFKLGTTRCGDVNCVCLWNMLFPFTGWLDLFKKTTVN